MFGPNDKESPAKIKVIGVGDGGGNAVNTMIQAQVGGVEFIAVNTDLPALSANLAPTKIQIGSQLTKGLGTGANPEIGRNAALKDIGRLSEALDGADMVFVIAGMGGGTGTGAASIIAAIAKEQSCLTVAVVTTPFLFEGRRRIKQAEDGLRTLVCAADTTIVIPNQRLFKGTNWPTSLREAFRISYDLLLRTIRGISDIMAVTGLINLDFADIQTVMLGGGRGSVGMGAARWENRAVEAAEKAISNPLLEESSVQGARGVLINVTGGPDLTLYQFDEACSLIKEMAHEDAYIIPGAVIDQKLEEEIHVTVIATGFGSAR